MSTHEDDLMAALDSPIKAGVVKVIADCSPLVESLSEAFPFCGSKIAWSRTLGHIGAIEMRLNDREEFRRFFSARRRDLGGELSAYYLNDNQIDCAILARLLLFERQLEYLLNIPSHHYFFAVNFDWCMAYTMEGYVDFGRRPEKSTEKLE